jgi:hypothetical protein
MQQNLQASDLILTVEERARIEAVAAVQPPYPHSFLARFDRDPAVVAVR